MMAKINVKCEGCGKVHNLNRTEEIPDDVVSLICNWCIECEDTAKDYYTERYCYDEEPINNPNQQSLF